MMNRIGPGLALVVLGALSIAIAVITSSGTSTEWVNHGIATVLAAAIVTGVSYARHWTHFAWAPVAAFLVASIGVVIANTMVISIGYGLLVIMTLWHAYQVERPRSQPAVA